MRRHAQPRAQRELGRRCGLSWPAASSTRKASGHRDCARLRTSWALTGSVVSDVTRRYAPRWSEAVKLRIDSDAEQVTRACNQRRGRVMKGLRCCVAVLVVVIHARTTHGCSNHSAHDRGHSSHTAIDLEAEGRGRAQAEEEAELTAAAASLSPHCPLGPTTFGAIRRSCSHASSAAMKGLPTPTARCLNLSLFFAVRACTTVPAHFRRCTGVALKRHGRAVPKASSRGRSTPTAANA